MEERQTGRVGGGLQSQGGLIGEKPRMEGEQERVGGMLVEVGSRAEAAWAPLIRHVCTLSSAGKWAVWPSGGPGEELRRGAGEMGGQDESRGGIWGAVWPPGLATSLRVTWSQRASIVRVHFPLRPGRHPRLF